MLEISEYSVKEPLTKYKANSGSLVAEQKQYLLNSRLWITILLIIFIFMFLPWTQFINSKGFVTALLPEQRPQTIHALIDGQITRWYIQEGELVKKGDTILYLSEIKEDYLDPQLLLRTQEQITAKEQSIVALEQRISALREQRAITENLRVFKLSQLRNKRDQAATRVIADSMDLQAAIARLQITDIQTGRVGELFKEGLKSKTDKENQDLRQQEAIARNSVLENRFIASKQEYDNTVIELESIVVEFDNILARLNAEIYSTEVSLASGREGLAKLENMFSSYEVRAKYRYIVSPIDGYITQAIKTGIGETIKQGEPLLTLVPEETELAVELFVEPMDLPLISIGQDVRFVFDGWPAIVFAGWPNAAVGTFKGRVTAIDRFTFQDGKYRLLVSADESYKPWPDELRVGTGAQGLALLSNVPIWYEIWRVLNGFPPDYYKNNSPQMQANPKK